MFLEQCLTYLQNFVSPEISGGSPEARGEDSTIEETKAREEKPSQTADQTARELREKAEDDSELISKKLFTDEVNTFLIYIFGANNTPSMYNMNQCYGRLSSAGRQFAERIILQANQKLEKAGTPYSFKIEMDGVRADDGGG